MNGGRLLNTAGILSVLTVLFGLQPVGSAPGAEAPLDRPIELQLRAVSLEELCEALSTDEVRFLPDTREIGDYKVHALLHEVRLREAMAVVTQLFTLPNSETGLYWVRQAKGERVTYRLAARADFARRLAEARRKPWEQLRERLELLRDWPELGPHRQAEIARQHPVVAHQAGLAWDPGLVQLFWSDPRATALLGAAPTAVGLKDRITLRYSGADPAQQRLMATLRDAFLAHSTAAGNRPVGTLEETLLEFRMLPDKPLVVWRMQVGKGRAFLGDLAAPLVKVDAGTLVDSPEALPTSRSGWAGAREPAPREEPMVGERRAPESTRIDYLFEGMRALAGSGRVNFVAHARTAAALPYTLPGAGSLEARLDGLGKHYSYRFRRAGSVIVGEDTRWVLDYEAEVPLRLLQGWAERKQTRGRIDLDDLAQMTLVSPEQWTRLRITFPEVKGGSRWLPVWATLSPAQRRAAWSPQGLLLRADPGLGIRPGSILRVAYAAPASRPGNAPLGVSPVPAEPSAVLFSVEEPRSAARQTESSPLPPPDPQFRAEDIRK